MLGLHLLQSLPRLFMQKYEVRKKVSTQSLQGLHFTAVQSSDKVATHTIPIPGASLCHFYPEVCYFFFTKLGCLTHLCHWPFKIERFPKENVFSLAKGKNTGKAQIPHLKKEDTHPGGHPKTFPSRLNSLRVSFHQNIVFESVSASKWTGGNVSNRSFC